VQAVSQDFFTHYLRLGNDFTISPTMLDHLNIGFNRTNSKNVLPLAHADDAHKVQCERIAGRVAQQRFEGRFGSGEVTGVDKGGGAFESCDPIHRTINLPPV